MTKSPAAAALDSIVAEVLAPDLKSLGFRKKSRHWSHEAAEAHRGVTVQSSQFNVTSDSRFTVEIGASFVALGHPVPNAPGAWGTAVRRRLSGLRSEPIDEWFAFDALDEATIERAGADLDRTWAQLGRPFLTALQSPPALCDFVCETGSAELALHDPRHHRRSGLRRRVPKGVYGPVVRGVAHARGLDQTLFLLRPLCANLPCW